MEQAMIETRMWDVVEHLETEEDMAAYLDAALEDGDTALVVAVLGDIARQRNGAACARHRTRTRKPV
jgi:probable addiction module antidote protein